MRINYNGGSFGNKKTWERPFEELFIRFIAELDEFSFDNGQNNKAVNSNALNCEETADLVYIDPPYFNSNGKHTTYHSKYHFLEGLANYDEIPNKIDFLKKNRAININKIDEFEKAKTFLNDLEHLILKHINSIIVVSYRNNGKHTINQITELMSKCKPNNHVYSIDLGLYGYALNKSNSSNNEYLIIGTNFAKI